MHITGVRRALAALALVTALALAGCAAPSADPAPSAPAAAVAVTDAWVKAAEGGMTAAFATITNDGDADVSLVGVSTEAASMVQLHETVADADGNTSMQEKAGGFRIPAGDARLLEPGGDHIMLMGLTGPLQPGDEVELVLVFDDGAERTVRAPVKEFVGAKEEYSHGADTAGGGAHDGMSGEHDAPGDGHGGHAE